MRNDYCCPTCQHEFNDRSVYCEDWRDIDRRFGCPACKTFFHIENVDRPKSRAAEVFGGSIALSGAIIALTDEKTLVSTVVIGCLLGVMLVSGVFALRDWWLRRDEPMSRLVPVPQSGGGDR